MQDIGGQLFQSVSAGGIILLNGDLGTGKTTLVRGFLRAAGVQGSIRSPTYTLLEHYEMEKMTIIHMDLYRLSEPEELEYLGVRDFQNDQYVLLIEWPEKAQGFFDDYDLKINFSYHADGRQLEFKNKTLKYSAV